MCPNFGKPKIIFHLEQNEKFIIFSVSVFKHITVQAGSEFKLSDTCIIDINQNCQFYCSFSL